MGHRNYNNLMIIYCIENAIRETFDQRSPNIISYYSALPGISFNSGNCFVNTYQKCRAQGRIAILIVLVCFGDIRFGFLPNG